MINFDDIAGMAMMGIIVTVPFVLLGAIPGSVLLFMLIGTGIAIMFASGKE